MISTRVDITGVFHAKQMDERSMVADIVRWIIITPIDASFLLDGFFDSDHSIDSLVFCFYNKL